VTVLDPIASVSELGRVTETDRRSSGSTERGSHLASFILASVGALLVGAGAVAPWVTVGIPNESAHTTLRGTDLRDGIVTLVCAVLCLGILLVERGVASRATRQRVAIVGGIAGISVACLAVAFLVGGRDRDAVVSALGVPRALWASAGAFRDVRYGVELVLLGAVLCVAGFVMMFRATSAERLPEPAA
jgi:hypothetical protein